MRKDVKRSLFLWPAMATVIVAAILGYTILRDFSQCIGPDTESLALATQPWFEFSGSTIVDVEFSSRNQYGRRAMELPPRVAKVLGIGSLHGAADKDQFVEVILPPWGIVIETPGSAATNTMPALETTFSTPTAVDRTDESNDFDIDQFFDELVENEADQFHALKLESPDLAKPESESPAIDQTALLAGIIELVPPASVLPKSNRALAKPELRSIPAPIAEPPAASSSPAALPAKIEIDAPAVADRQAIERRNPDFVIVGWPNTPLLDQQLGELTQLATGQDGRRHDQLAAAEFNRSSAAAWADQVTDTLADFRGLPRLGDDRAEPLIERLEQLAHEGVDSAERADDRKLQIQWLQASHSVARRVALWKPIWQLVNKQSATDQPSRFAIAMKPTKFVSVKNAVDSVQAMLPSTGDPDGWQKFLMLESIAEAADAGDSDQRFDLARQFISRVNRPGLHPAHRQWLQSDAIVELQAALRPWAKGVVNYADLLSQIERREAMTTDQSAAEIATAMQTLRFADSEDADGIAASIDTHYRNANLRVAISQQMLERWIPEVPDQSVPVRTRMLGSRVRGQSQIDSNLAITLVPATDRWSLRMQTHGQVQTQAIGHRGPVAVRTQAHSAFVATTPIEVTPTGIRVQPSTASVHGHTQLQGIRTDYDGWPLIGDLMRSAAARRFDAMSNQSTQISNRRIAAELEGKVSQEMHTRIEAAAKNLQQRIQFPLSRLQLNPLVTDMQTTEDRLIARYRLAGIDQLAAFTPRPRAMNTSLVSMQMHQSAINNALEQLVPTEHPQPIREAITSAISTFTSDPIKLPQDIPDDVSVQFSRTQPIVAEFKDDVVWLTMRILRLQRGERLNLTKFIVQAVYRPEVNGTTARLVRQGHLRISGPGMSMRERLPIRAIFNKVLASGRPLTLTPVAMTDHPALAGLAINQFDIRDGWVAIAIGPNQTDRIATDTVGRSAPQ